MTDPAKKPFAITLDPGSSLANHTGTWRTMRPVYVDRLPPCNNACPAGENIQGWLYHAEEGNYEQAWRTLTFDTPFPAVMGRVCYHPCESACNRAALDQTVNIHAVERFLGELAIEKGWQFDRSPSTGQRVAVVGAGPSGLSASYHLMKLGHQVTLFDAGPRLGGMMRFGIPKYRLSRDILDAEIQRIVNLGVEVRLNTAVKDVEALFAEEGFAAVFLAIGAHIGKRTEIPAKDTGKILDAVTLLQQMELGEERPQIGRRVAVYGGGNTAMDVARTAKRLGAEEAMIIYRRDREHMPAHDFEAEEALEEGVVINWLRTITQIDGDELTVEVMELDEHGRPQPTGQTETLAADSLILALGQNVDSEFLKSCPGVVVRPDGIVDVGPNMMTGRQGLFAGGDMVPADRTVTTAVGHGKLAARNVDAFLRGETYQHPERSGLATAERLNPWYYSDASRSTQAVLSASRRVTGFEEYTAGLTEETAKFEARRCLSCGNCFECDNCYGVCPDNAVIKLGPGNRYQFNLDYCKGCGICAEECPCGAIDMVSEVK